MKKYEKDLRATVALIERIVYAKETGNQGEVIDVNYILWKYLCENYKDVIGDIDLFDVMGGNLHCSFSFPNGFDSFPVKSNRY